MIKEEELPEWVKILQEELETAQPKDL